MMCDCSCDLGDGEQASVERTEHPRARKPHLCCECGRTIEAGQVHEHWAGLCDGHWLDFRTCSTCVRIRTDVCGSSWIFGELAEMVRSCLGVEL